MAEKCGCEYHPQRSYKFDHCRNCGARKSEQEHISLRGYCLSCACEREATNTLDLAAHRGEFYEKFVTGILRYAQTAVSAIAQSDRGSTST